MIEIDFSSGEKRLFPICVFIKTQYEWSIDRELLVLSLMEKKLCLLIVGLHDYDKIIIVDYSLEIVIAIINNDYFLNRFMPLFEAACHIFI